MTATTLKLQNYQIVECLHTGSKTLVYRAKRISDSQSSLNFCKMNILASLRLLFRY